MEVAQSEGTEGTAWGCGLNRLPVSLSVSYISAYHPHILK